MKPSMVFTVHAGLSGAVGLCLLMAAATLDSVAWTLVELPGANNSIIPGVLLAASGLGFLVVALAGGIAGFVLRGRDRQVPVGVAVTSVLGTFGAGVVALHGATVESGRAIASVLRAVVSEAWLLEPPTYDGQALVTGALVTVMATGLMLFVPRRGAAGAGSAAAPASATGHVVEASHQGR